jgi:hypothetical protein
MLTLYYSLMRNLLASLLWVLPVFVEIQSPPAQQPKALRTSIIESHEGMTIGVDPWTFASRYKDKFPKKSPFSGGVVAIRVSFRNESEESVKIDLNQIRLLLQLGEDNRQEIAPLTAEEVADTVLLKDSGKDPTAKRNPLPVPLGKPKASRDANWTSFKEACQNAAVPSSVVAAHGSLEGLFYFDIRGEWDLLQSARLYIPNLVTMNDKHPLFYFDIDLGHAPGN